MIRVTIHPTGRIVRLAQLRSISAAGLALLLVCRPGFSAEFVVGGVDHSWQESGTTPGGVIDFVERIESVVDGERPLFVTEQDQFNWIMPVRVDPDVNISLGLLDRGGEIDINLSEQQIDRDQLEGVLNGDHKLAFDRKPIDGQTILNNGITIFIDLGARFGVNRILFYPRMTPQFPFGNDFMRGYELYINDGQPENLFASGQPNFVSPVSRNTDNADTTVVVEIDAQFVRFLQLKSVINAGFEIDEIEIFGTGFVPEASYESHPLALEDQSVWGQIRWLEVVAGDPRDSSIEVRARSGSDDTPDAFFREVLVNGVRSGLSPNDDQGNPLTPASYERLLRDGRAVIKQTDAENWGQWQLVSNGQTLSLPAPRRFLQFRIDVFNGPLGSARRRRLPWSREWPMAAAVPAARGATSRPRRELPPSTRFPCEMPAAPPSPAASSARSTPPASCPCAAATSPWRTLWPITFPCDCPVWWRTARRLRSSSIRQSFATGRASRAAPSPTMLNCLC